LAVSFSAQCEKVVDFLFKAQDNERVEAMGPQRSRRKTMDKITAFQQMAILVLNESHLLLDRAAAVAEESLSAKQAEVILKKVARNFVTLLTKAVGLRELDENSLEFNDEFQKILQDCEGLVQALRKARALLIN
jgi:hypothetical protein